jgi:hypothetical protein
VALCLTLGLSPIWCAGTTKREIFDEIAALKADGQAGEQIIVVGGKERTIKIDTYHKSDSKCFDDCPYFVPP